MKKVKVVYYSNTGNTEAMANAIMSGLKDGCEAELIPFSDFTVDMAEDCDVIIFGCPACGSEELDESYVEPFFSSNIDKLSSKNVALFGSYGWGGGEWLETWKSRLQKANVNVVDTIMCEQTPDDSALQECVKFGKKLI